MIDVAAFPLTIKSLTEAGHIEGLAAAFGNVDLGGDRIIPGAFTRSLAGRTNPLPMLLHHKFDRPIGRWDSLTETREGLLAKGRITLEATDGREAYALARDGALGGLSVGYQTVDSKRGKGARDLIELALHEVSLVSIPMNPLARVRGIKSISGPRDIADLFREAGISSRRAKAAAGAAWRAINEDEDPTETKLAEMLTTASASLSRFHKG
jgi:uncharacterized protein